MENKPKFLAVVHMTLQDMDPTAVASPPLPHCHPATWAFLSSPNTPSSSPSPDLAPCSSFCQEWSFSALPGVGSFSSVTSQLKCPLPNQTCKVDSPNYSLFYHCSFPYWCNHMLYLFCLLALLCQSPQLESYRTGTLSHLVQCISSSQNSAWCVQ